MTTLLLMAALLGEPESYNAMRDRQKAEIHAKNLQSRRQQDQRMQDSMKPRQRYSIKSNGRQYFYRDYRGVMRNYDPGVRAVPTR